MGGKKKALHLIQGVISEGGRKWVSEGWRNFRNNGVNKGLNERRSD